MNNQLGIKKVDVFNDIVSRLEDTKAASVSNNVVLGMKKYYHTNQGEYRSRALKLLENLNGVKPIDKEVNNVIYIEEYIEKGVAIKASISSLKQTWVEYRLIYNENKAINKRNIEPEANDTLANFDEIYKNLSSRVDSAKKHIDELKHKREDLSKDTNRLLLERQSLEREKRELAQAKTDFEKYKKEEELKLDARRKEVSNKVVKLQTLIDNLDATLNMIDQ